MLHTEFSLIQEFFAQSECASPKIAAAHQSVVLGIGDDCALLKVPMGQELAMSMDTLVAGRHFFEDGPADWIAERAFRVSVSDLAAMGAEPLAFTLSLSIPFANSDWLRNFSQGLCRAAGEFHCRLIGGDTVRGPLAATIQVHGLVPEGEALRRSGASVGDGVWVSGPLGDSAAALELRTFDVSNTAYWDKAYWCPEPQLKLGAALRKVASAAIDISDGLLSDLGHIASASDVGFDLDLDSIPLSAPIRRALGEAKARELALRGGDDYQLCFTVSPEQEARIPWDQFPEVQRIGECVSTSGIRCRVSGRRLDKGITGFDHFSGELA